MDKTLQFDARGNLFPATVQEVLWSDFESNFVLGNHRSKLCKNFRSFVMDIKREISPEFWVWVDGSFVGQKEIPHDIDALFLLGYRICERKKSVLDNVYFAGKQKYTEGLDLYYTAEYPESHKRHFLSHLNHLYWDDIYGHTRQDSNGKRFSKGYVKIKIV